MACSNPKCKNPDCQCGGNCTCDETHQCNEKADDAQTEKHTCKCGKKGK